jgi:phage-related protein
MYHSINFTDGLVTKNTWTSWYLIPSSRPVVNVPEPVYKYVDIPGMDGSLDASNYLTGKPSLSDCSGSFSFYVMNDHGPYADRKAEIAEFLDGREMTMKLEDDPDYHYVGRFHLSKWEPGASYSMATIDYRVAPYKIRTSDGKKVRS